MALLGKLKDLISFSQSVPQYAPNDPVNVPLIGPDGQDWSIDTENPDGPLRQIGTKRVATSTGRKLLAGLPDIISSGITAAAHPNVAGGGPTDFFGALQDVDTAREHKQQVDLTRRRQAQLDADNEAYKRAQTTATLAKPSQEDAKIETGRQRANTEADRVAETGNYNRGRLGNASESNEINARKVGFSLTMPSITPTTSTQPQVNTSIFPQGHPASRSIVPTPEADLSEQQKANLGKTAAQTSLTTAQTGLAGARTADVKEHTRLAPDLLELRNKMAGMTLQRIGNEKERIKLAKDIYNWNYNGIDQNGDAVFQDEEGNTISPKALAATKLSAGATAKVNQAQSVMDASEIAKRGLSGLEKNGQLGPIKGRYEDVLAQLGTSSPDVKKALVEIDNLASLLPATHGMRGTAAYDNFKTSIGGIGQNPANAYAAIDAIKEMAQDIAKNNSQIRTGKVAQRSGHPASTVSPPPAAPKVVNMVSKTGQPFQVTEDRVDDAIQHYGAKRAQ